MLRESVAPKVESHERGFRWRSHEISRIEGLSDAVFAFAVTLLIVSLEVPRTFAELWETINGFLPFAISFAMLIQIWYIQFTWFRRYGLQDALILFSQPRNKRRFRADRFHPMPRPSSALHASPICSQPCCTERLGTVALVS